MARLSIIVLFLSSILLVQADHNKHNSKDSKSTTSMGWWDSMWAPGSAVLTFTESPTTITQPPPSSEVWWREIRSDWVATMTTFPSWAESVWEEELTMPTTTATKFITTIVPSSLARARRENMTTTSHWF